ncbi:ester cyclase [Methanocella sp.]|uniref:ester cyclase n=1 Tax=Methanocella sp. TaxID=2052833 RepID=UPI002D7EC2AA|nr:ester cyclase [Methanocella sp.]
MYSEEMNVEKENKALVRRFYEDFYNRSRLDAIDDMFDPSYIHHTPEVPEEKMSYEEYREHILSLARAFPHMKVTIDDQVAEKDRVATRYTMYGIQEGDLPGIPARGRDVKVAAMTILSVKGGRIVEGWEVYDSLDMALQLGVAQVVSTLSKGPQEKGYFTGWEDYNV